MYARCDKYEYEGFTKKKKKKKLLLLCEGVRVTFLKTLLKIAVRTAFTLCCSHSLQPCRPPGAGALLPCCPYAHCAPGHPASLLTSLPTAVTVYLTIYTI